MAYAEEQQNKMQEPYQRVDDALIHVLASHNFRETFLSTKAITGDAGIEERILYYDEIGREYVVLRKRAGEKFRKEIYRGGSFYDAFNRWQYNRQLTIGEYDRSTIEIARQTSKTISQIEMRKSNEAEAAQEKRDAQKGDATALADAGKAQGDAPDGIAADRGYPRTTQPGPAAE